MSGVERVQALGVEWLREILGPDVTSLDVQPVAFTGATTDMARLDIGYRDAAADRPRTLIAKLRGQRDIQQQMDSVMGLFAREAAFYANFADAVPVRTPRCWFIGDGDSTPLLLEDLGTQRMGDQMDGMTLPDARATMDALADLHAAHWASDQLADPALASPGEGIFAGLIGHLVASGAPALAERYADTVPADVMAAVLERAPVWPQLLARLVEGPQTLIHNDTRLDNLFFGADGTPCFIDWQVVARGRGTQDVGNLLAGSMDGDDLSANWESLLQRYHARLVGNGVSGYSYDDCVEHYRQNIVYPLGAGMALLGAMDIGDGRGLGDKIITRCLRHIAELQSFKTL
jgi:Ecdysteroid kinase-like family